MNGMRRVISLAFGVLALIALVGCSGPGSGYGGSPIETPTVPPSALDTPTPIPTLPPTATAWPTETPLPTQIPYATNTPIPASQMRGEWRRITTADGLCTDWPVFIGVWYIGTGTTTVCYAPDMSVDEITWITRTVPLGTRVTAVGKFPPGGGEMFATDAGVCWYDGVDWNCQKVADGYPYQDIRRIAHINEVPVLMLTSTVVYLEQTYSIPEIVGANDARPTWIAIGGEYNSSFTFIYEIWVGTNGYGVVVIRPGTGEITRYTTADGLPGNVIRDIDVGADVWVATDDGVGRWDGQHWTAYTTTDGLPSNDVRGVAVGEAGTVWAATADGAAYFDGQSWRAFTREDGLPEGDLNGVIGGSGGAVFSTRGSGLLVFSIPEWSSYADTSFSVVFQRDGELWMSEIGGRGEQLLTNEGLHTDEGPYFGVSSFGVSPGGRFVAYIVLDEHNAFVKVMDIREENTRVVGSTRETEPYTVFVWFFQQLAWWDEAHIAYYVVEPSPPREVFDTGRPLKSLVFVNLETGESLTETVSTLQYPSPDGQYVLSGHEFRGLDPDYQPYWLHNRQTGEQRMVTDEDMPAQFLGWSPDGRLMLFDLIYEREVLDVLLVVDAEMRAQWVITPEGKTVSGSCAAWSPDGQTIAYLQCDPPTTGCENPELWLTSPDGTNRRRIPMESIHCSRIAWTPDGTHLVLETNREPAIWSVRVDGGDLRPIADGQNPQVLLSP